MLSLAYLAWLAWSARAVRPGLVALAVAAPVLWALSDLAVTGDLLWSLHHTRTGTELLDRDTGVGAAVDAAAAPPELPARRAGARRGAAGARGRPARRAASGCGGSSRCSCCSAASFGVLALAGLSLQPRYLAGLAAAVVVCAAIGGLGWLVLGGERRRGGALADRRRWWPLLAAGPRPFDARDFARRPRAAASTTGAQLEALARGPARADALRDCGPVAVPTIRPIPYLALWTDADPAAFVETGARRRRTPARSSRRRRPSESWAGGGGEGQPPRVVVAPPPGVGAGRADAAWVVASACG